MRVGVLGAGLAGEFHAREFDKIEDVELVAIADQDAERAGKLSEQYGAKAFGSWEELVESGEVEALGNALPHFLHEPSTTAAAERGIHVLLEKLMAPTIRECESINRACKANAVNLMIGFSHRFHSELLTARRLIDDGEIGRVAMAIDNMSFGAEDFPKWVWNKETGGGGILAYNNIHGLDRLMWLVGSDIAEVHGRTGMFAHEGDAEDNAVASLVFENGAIGATLTNYNPYEVPKKCDLDIYGVKGSIRVDTWNQITFSKRLVTWTQKREIDDHLRAEFEEFINSIREDRRPSVTGEDGVRAQRVLLAIYESANSGRAVTVSDLN
jgi:predicted dehydrogenase